MTLRAQRIVLPSDKIQTLIDLYGYTRADMTEQTDVTNHFLSSLRTDETVTLDKSNLKSLADVFHTSPATLCDPNVSAYDIFVSYLIETGKLDPSKFSPIRRPTMLIERDILNEADRLLHNNSGVPIDDDTWDDMLIGIAELFQNRDAAE